jgi:hypothetical protein
MVFDSFFAGSLTVDNLKETTKEEQLVRRASKQAIKETKASEVTKPGKVRLAITPFSIVAERVVKVSHERGARTLSLASQWWGYGPPRTLRALTGPPSLVLCRCPRDKKLRVWLRRSRQHLA